MDVLAGRKTDHLVTQDGTMRHALSLIYALRAMDGVQQFQVQQRSDRSVDVTIACANGAAKHVRQHVQSALRDCVGDLPTRIHLAPDIPPSPSGKFRHVISHALQE